jgi:hypothetical protein
MKKVISSRARMGIILLGVAVLVAAALTATTRAASIRTAAVVTVSPHVLTVGGQGFITIKFMNSGPSTVNHVVATVRDKSGADLGLPKASFDPYPKPAGCTVVSTSATTSFISCDVGQVPGGTVVRRVIRFDASVVTAFTARVSATFDESKQNGLTDTVFDDDLPFAIVGSDRQDQRGQCTAATSDQTLLAFGASQQTSLTYHPLTLSADIPCTPASSGVAPLPPVNLPGVAKPFNAISFVDFLDGAGLSTARVEFLTVPKGIGKKNLALFEMANYPDLTLTANGAAVPQCVNSQIPANSPFHSCVVGVDTLSGGGLVATLLVRGGSDPGWGGIG